MIKKILAVSIIGAIIAPMTTFAATSKTKPVEYPTSIYCSEVVDIAKNKTTLSKLSAWYIKTIFDKFPWDGKSDLWTYKFFTEIKWSVFSTTASEDVLKYLNTEIDSLSSYLTTCKAEPLSKTNSKLASAIKSVEKELSRSKMLIASAKKDFEKKKPTIVKFYSDVKSKWTQTWPKGADMQTWKKFSRKGNTAYDKTWNVLLSVFIQSQNEIG